MPIYVYRCASCSETLEELQKFSDPPLTACPACGGSLQKQFTPQFGLSFKGSGFYITDYKNRSNGKAETGTSDTSKTEKKSTNSADSTEAKTHKAA